VKNFLRILILGIVLMPINLKAEPVLTATESEIVSLSAKVRELEDKRRDLYKNIRSKRSEIYELASKNKKIPIYTWNYLARLNHEHISTREERDKTTLKIHSLIAELKNVDIAKSQINSIIQKYRVMLDDGVSLTNAAHDSSKNIQADDKKDLRK
jgi:uncharacterized coiled-coil DUF342 family protein